MKSKLRVSIDIYRSEGLNQLFHSIRNHLYWWCRKHKYISKIRAGWIRYRSSPEIDVFRVHWIDPINIKKISGSVSKSNPGSYHLEEINQFPSRSNEGFGSFVGGDWDTNTTNFEDLVVFQSFYNRFKQGLAWEETELFQKHRERIEKGYRSYGCRSTNELVDKLKNYGELYNQIRHSGYQTQSQLNGTSINEIRVNIGRSGDILYHGEGRHRLSIAKILDLDAVPVIIHTRHENLIYPTGTSN